MGAKAKAIVTGSPRGYASVTGSELDLHSGGDQRPSSPGAELLTKDKDHSEDSSDEEDEEKSLTDKYCDTFNSYLCPSCQMTENGTAMMETWAQASGVAGGVTGVDAEWLQMNNMRTGACDGITQPALCTRAHTNGLIACVHLPLRSGADDY